MMRNFIGSTLMTVGRGPIMMLLVGWLLLDPCRAIAVEAVLAMAGVIDVFIFK